MCVYDNKRDKKKCNNKEKKKVKAFDIMVKKKCRCETNKRTKENKQSLEINNGFKNYPKKKESGRGGEGTCTETI